MIRSQAIWRRRTAVLAGAALCAVPAYAVATSGIAALKRLENGRWNVRELDGALANTAICLGDPAQLVRFEHRAVPGCTSNVLASGDKTATVQYNCKGRGYGHSTLRVETPRTIRIDTQGLSNGRPFSYRLEARRAGAC